MIDAKSTSIDRVEVYRLYVILPVIGKHLLAEFDTAESAEDARRKISGELSPAVHRFRGVTVVFNRNRDGSERRAYRATIRYAGQPRFIGVFDREIEAAEAFDEAIVRLRARFPSDPKLAGYRLNFPDRHIDPRSPKSPAVHAFFIRLSDALGRAFTLSEGAGLTPRPDADTPRQPAAPTEQPQPAPAPPTTHRRDPLADATVNFAGLPVVTESADNLRAILDMLGAVLDDYVFESSERLSPADLNRGILEKLNAGRLPGKTLGDKCGAECFSFLHLANELRFRSHVEPYYAEPEHRKLTQPCLTVFSKKEIDEALSITTITEDV